MRDILIDCDGILGQFAPEVIRFLNQCAEPGTVPYTLDSITDFDILESTGNAHMQERLDQHMIDTDFCRYMPVYPGAHEFVGSLRGLGYTVVCVTSPYRAVPNWCNAREAWLWEHFEIPSREVVFAKAKGRVNGIALVDDKARNVWEFGERGILFDRPWNRTLEARGAFRVHTYQEVLDRLLWLPPKRVCAL